VARAVALEESMNRRIFFAVLGASGPIAYLIYLLRSKRNELTLPRAKEGTSYTVTNLSEQPLVLRGTRTQPLTGWSDVELKKGDTYTFEVKGKHWVVKP
jgi:hypothetical protein